MPRIDDCHSKPARRKWKTLFVCLTFVWVACSAGMAQAYTDCGCSTCGNTTVCTDPTADRCWGSENPSEHQQPPGTCQDLGFTNEIAPNLFGCPGNGSGCGAAAVPELTPVAVGVFLLLAALVGWGLRRRHSLAGEAVFRD